MVIATDVPALVAIDAAQGQLAALAQAEAALATGQAAPGPGPQAIATLMHGELGALGAAQSNVAQGEDLLATATGGVQQAIQIVQQIQQLAVEASNSTLTPQQGQTIQAQVDALLGQLGQIGGQTQYNGLAVLAGGGTGPGAVVPLAAGSLAVSVAAGWESVAFGGPVLASPTPGLSVTVDGAQGVPAGDAIVADVEIVDVTELVPAGAYFTATYAGAAYVDVWVMPQDQVWAPAASVPLGSGSYMPAAEGSGVQAVPVALPGGGTATVTVTWQVEGLTTPPPPYGSGGGVFGYTGYLNPPGLVWWVGAAALAQVVPGLVVQSGPGPADETVLALPALSSAALGLAGLDVATPSAAQAALPHIAGALDALAAMAGQLGSETDALQVRQAGNAAEGLALTGSRATLTGADLAAVAESLARHQALLGAGLAAVVSAERLPRAVLSLLA